MASLQNQDVECQQVKQWSTELKWGMLLSQTIVYRTKKENVIE